MVNQLLTPGIAYALTAGPTAPEATSFEPIDTTDMVNPINGSFTYNLPLLEVPGPEGGYPLSLSYHAGVQPNEESSWAGLGWTLNPGAIARNVNGYPDDWSSSAGAGGTTSSYWVGGTTKIYTAGITLGIAGTPASVNFGLAFASDTYRGFGIGYDIGFGLQLDGGKSPFGIGATIGVSPFGGAYASANISYTANIKGLQGLKSTTGLGIQTNFKSISGDLSEGISTSGGSLMGASIGTSSMKPNLSLGGGSVTSVNDINKGKLSTSSSGFQIPIPIYPGVTLSLGYEQERYWSSTSSSYTANGVLNNLSSITEPGGTSNTSDDDNYSLDDPINYNIIDKPDPLAVAGGTFPNFDDYSVMAQGLGGNMRPYILSSVLFNENRVNTNDHSNDEYSETFPANAVPVPLGKKWQFRFINDIANCYTQGHPWNSDSQFSFDGNPKYGFGSDGNYGYDASTNRLEGSTHIEYFTNAQISTSGYSSSGYAISRGFITCPDGAGFSRSNCIPNQIGGFMITNASGVTYHYALPAYSGSEMVYTQKTDASGSQTLTKTTPYAYTWYLTAITGPDYVSRGATPGQIDKSDWGYWVKFDYGKWASSFNWRTPSHLFATDNDNSFQSYSQGAKDIYYLDAIETRTHTAIFVKELRNDGKSNSATDAANANSSPKTGVGYFDNTSVSSLGLNNIILLKNDQFTSSLATIRAASGTGTVLGANANNIIDVYDLSSLTESLSGKSLRKVQFSHDYSLCPNTANSFANGSNSVTYGKYTLLSVDFQGRGGAAMTPPVKFQYDLDPTNPANQGSISILSAPTNNPGVNQTGTIQTQSSNSFVPGDILSFPYNGTTYYCTLLSATYNGFNVMFLNNSPGGVNSSQIFQAVKTKNPPYNYDAFDNWYCYKSDYIANPANVNLARTTTPVSNAGTDVWSLRKIISSVGANININYEGNTYCHSVLNKNPSMIVGNNGSNQTISEANTGNPNYTTYYNLSTNINSDYTLDLIASNPQNIDLTASFKVGARVSGPLVFARNQQSYAYSETASPEYQLINLNAYPKTTVVSVNGNDIKIQLDPALFSFLNSAPFRGTGNWNGTPPNQNASFYINYIYLVTGNLISTGESNYNYGGGVRVKNVIVDDLNGSVKETAYNYGALGAPAGLPSTSGVTSFLPNTLDFDNLSSALNSSYINQTDTMQANIYNDYRRILYNHANYLLSVSRIVPAPGVLYETVAVNDYSIMPDGSSVPIDGATVYQYETFKPEMLGIMQYYFNSQNNINGTQSSASGSRYLLNQKTDRDITVKDYTSRVGNLKRIITYDNYGNKLSEKINHYLNDDLDNTSLQNQVNNYEPRLATFTNVPNSNYNGVSYNNLGVIKERYGTARVVTDPAFVKDKTNPNVNYYDEFLVMSNQETFPSFLTGTTQIDYKNGTTMSESNLAYDFYSGAVTKTLTTDSYGNRYISVATPAYMAGYGIAGTSTLTYPALGLKTHDDVPSATQHKQMLSQQAANYTFSVDGSNTYTGIVSAGVQTWSVATPLDPNGNAVADGSEANIWRMANSYYWLPTGPANNLQPYSSFADYFGNTNGGSGNSNWKNISAITQYNVYSAALEVTDIDQHYAATRMGYNNTKVIATSAGARYNEIAYAGAEDPLLPNGNFSCQVSPGNGTIVADTTKAHSGTNSLMVGVNSKGFIYTVPLTSLNPSRQNYSIAVWVKPAASGSVTQTTLYYSVNGGSPVTANQTYAKTAAGWYLLEMTVPSSAISGTSGNLVVGCQNGALNSVYFDDFRFQPSITPMTAYVYDNVTGDLTYILGNKNLYVRFQYDAIGRLVRTYREVLGKTTVPLLKAVTYNYGRSN